MGKGLEFIRETIREALTDQMLNYGISKTVEILLDLELGDEQIKQALTKHFDIRYSEAEKVLNEAKSVLYKN